VLKLEDVPALRHALWETKLALEVLANADAVAPACIDPLRWAVHYVEMVIKHLGDVVSVKTNVEWMTAGDLAKFLGVAEDQVEKCREQAGIDKKEWYTRAECERLLEGVWRFQGVCSPARKARSDNQSPPVS
jgi:hypothetical protein